MIFHDLSVRNGVVPSYREMAEVYGSAHSAVFSHVRALIKKGYLTRRGGARGGVVSRALRLTPAGEDYVKIELLIRDSKEGER